MLGGWGGRVVEFGRENEGENMVEAIYYGKSHGENREKM